MKGLYVLAVTSLLISLLSLSGILFIYYQVNALNLTLAQDRERLRELHNAVLKLQDELRTLRSNISQQAFQQQVTIYRNLTAPELVYEKVKDSVVLIKATTRVRTILGEYYASSQGSGFVYDSLGHIVTNYHVIEDAVGVEVFFPDRSSFKAEIVGSDPYADLAVLEIDPGNKTLKPLILGNSSSLRVGQPVIAIGNPYGFAASLTSGVISQLKRCIPSPEGRLIPNVIQFDAAVNPGSSGGPLLDYSGRIIGVTTAIYSETGEFAGIGFAIPSNTVAKVVRSIIETGRYQHPWIGIAGVDVNMEIARIMGLPEARGFLITEVAEGSPAEKAGLRAGTKRVSIRVDGRVREVKVGGDVILAVDEVEIFGIADLLAYLEEHKRPGDAITLSVYRNGEVVKVNLTLGAIPP
ncbi:MAG TPA: PDZ domain-containing protein [Nitrososphaeria archaeon]|nr:PDZ domain-containing protein [Nitrososphaeria archaeon]